MKKHILRVIGILRLSTPIVLQLAVLTYVLSDRNILYDCIALIGLAGLSLAVIMAHDREVLRLRLVFLVGYGIVIALSFLSFFFPWETEAGLLRFMLLPALGMAPLLIPGVLRSYFATIGRLLRCREAGSLEALSLATTYLAQNFEDVRDASRFVLIQRKFTLIFPVELVLAYIVRALQNAYFLTSATIHRGFRVSEVMPTVDIKTFEIIFIILVTGILLCLKVLI